MSKFSVTMKDLRQAGACFRGYNRLVSALTHQSFDQQRRSYMRCCWPDPVSIEFIIDSNGFDDALWALQCLTEADRDLRMYAVWCARQVQDLITDQRSLEALSVAERFANGRAMYQLLGTAWWNAWDASADCDLNQAAALQAAAHTCNRSAHQAAYLASGKATVAASSKHFIHDAIEWPDMRTRQTDMLRRMCQGTAPWQTSSP